MAVTFHSLCLIFAVIGVSGVFDARLGFWVMILASFLMAFWGPA